MNIRKTGSDMTSALLWAAFSIGVLISIISVYLIVEINSRKREFSEIAHLASTELRRVAKSYESIYAIPNPDTILQDYGIIPSQYVTADNELVLPYGLEISFGANSAQEVTVSFSAPDSRLASAVCHSLKGVVAVGEDVITGPMGSNYVLEVAECDRGAGELFIQAAYDVRD